MLGLKMQNYQTHQTASLRCVIKIPLNGVGDGLFTAEFILEKPQLLLMSVLHILLHKQ